MRRPVLLLGVVLAVLVAGCHLPPPSVRARHRPDLVVMSVSDPPADGTKIASLSVSVATANVGDASARRSVTRLLLSLDDQLGATDVVLGDVHVPRLRRGTTPYATTAEVAVPASLQPLAYHLVACADATRRVKEVNETNNCRASAGTISFAPPPPPPPPGQGSAQELIAKDLDAGLIDYPTSLQYRTWALFRDLRLPARYGDARSAGEDRALFAELDAAFDTLPADVQTAVKPYLVPPNDPASAFGPAPAAPAAGAAAIASDAQDTRCHSPATWMHTDWTPAGGGADDGFRIWVCAGSDNEANLIVKPVMDVASSLWEPMTRPEPDGMGKPVPDLVTGATPHGGNGKIDVLIVHTSDCSDRTCPLFSPDDPTGPFRLGLERTWRDTCQLPGYPARSCSGYLTLNAGVICPDVTVCTNAELEGAFAHEFFHLLQDAHNADVFSRVAFKVGSRVSLEKSWYSEASAEWAAWYYAKDPDAYPYFVDAFQPNNDSLLAFGQGHEYGSWVWPLLMQREIGASAVFTSWHDAEQAATPQALDDAVDHTMAFADHFRDLSVSNLNAKEYFDGHGVGLEPDLWQTQVGDFPKDEHVHGSAGAIGLGDQSVFVDVAPLAADDTQFTIPATVRQVTIDVSSLAHADTADIDVVGRLAPASGHESDPPAWRRVRGSGSTLTFCRDNPSEDFDLAYVVLSNHARTRAPLGGPASDAAVKGVYDVEAKNACAAPDHYDATFTGFSAVGDSWSGSATFDLIGAGSNCDPLTPPTPDDLTYCYRSVDGNAQWKYTDPNGATYTSSVRLLPTTDSGFIDLRMQTGDPNYDGSYKTGILPLSGAHLMPVGDGQRDAADFVLAWVGAPDASLGNPPKIGAGFQLTGTWRGCAEGACQGWTWNYKPRWN